MNLRKLTLCAYVFLAMLSSCEKDDAPEFVAIPPRDRAEQQITDKDSLLNYLETHYFNEATFLEPGTHSITELVIQELPRDTDGSYMPLPNPDTNKILMDSDLLETLETTYQDVPYEYYVLRLNTGAGDAPRFTDQVRVVYTGNLMDGVVFDSTPNPTDLQLLRADGSGVIEGWKLVFPTFNSSTSFMSNSDGTISYEDYGLGAMFLPSGLAYFEVSPNSLIPTYSNLIFKFELLQIEVLDHDDDGIPSYVEDLEGNNNIFDNDTDGDFRLNYVDPDDDGDGVLTLNELDSATYLVIVGEEEPTLAANEYERSRTTSDGVITIKTVIAMDSDNNGTADYLESNITINYNE